jgi:hypothetical protein
MTKGVWRGVHDRRERRELETGNRRGRNPSSGVSHQCEEPLPPTTTTTLNFSVRLLHSLHPCSGNTEHGLLANRRSHRLRLQPHRSSHCVQRYGPARNDHTVHNFPVRFLLSSLFCPLKLCTLNSYPRMQTRLPLLAHPPCATGAPLV